MGKSFSKWGEKEFRKYLNGLGNQQAYDFLDSLRKRTIAVVVKKITNKGMCRQVRFYSIVVCGEQAYLSDISGFIARAGGFEMTKDNYGYEENVILHGCGYNVIYACLEHVYNHIKEYTDLADKSFDSVYNGCLVM